MRKLARVASSRPAQPAPWAPHARPAGKGAGKASSWSPGQHLRRCPTDLLASGGQSAPRAGRRGVFLAFAARIVALVLTPAGAGLASQLCKRRRRWSTTRRRPRAARQLGELSPIRLGCWRASWLVWRLVRRCARTLGITEGMASEKVCELAQAGAEVLTRRLASPVLASVRKWELGSQCRWCACRYLSRRLGAPTPGLHGAADGAARKPARGALSEWLAKRCKVSFREG